MYLLIKKICKDEQYFNRVNEVELKDGKLSLLDEDVERIAKIFNSSKKLVRVTCYNTTRYMLRKNAIKDYLEGMMYCEGSEQERYAKIYTELILGNKVVSDC